MSRSKLKGSKQTRSAAAPVVMTIDDLSTYLQVSKSSLYKLAQGGKVPGQKVGKHWRFHKVAIDGWLQATPPSMRTKGAAQQ